VRPQKRPKNARAHRKMGSLTPGIGYSMTSSLTSAIGQRWNRVRFSYAYTFDQAQAFHQFKGLKSVILDD
jgi:hypothetical protein